MMFLINGKRVNANIDTKCAFIMWVYLIVAGKVEF